MDYTYLERSNQPNKKTIKTMKIQEILLLAIALVFISILFFVAIGKGFDGYEVYECKKWQAEAKAYEGYFLADWQEAQCSHHGIKIDIPAE